MKLAASVSLVALALAGCATAAAQPAQTAAAERCRSRSGRGASYPVTAEGAARLHRRGRKGPVRLFASSRSQANWVNATYITDDTDALAAQINAIGTEKGVKYALEAAQVCRAFRASIPTRSASSTSCATARPCRPRPRRARRPSSTTIATDLQSQYGKGRGTLNGKPITGRRHRSGDGHSSATRRSSPRCGPSWHDNVGAPMRNDYARMVEHRQRRRQGTRLCRHRRDVAVRSMTCRPSSSRR